MTLFEDLPIYRDTYKITSLIVDYTNDFPKLYKYTIGSRMVDTSISLFEYISLAARSKSNKEQRNEYISSFIFKFEQLKVLIRLCNEKKIISLKQSAQLAELTASIGKQAAGWKDS